VIANLESPITANHEAWRASWKLYHFRADPAAVGILSCANVRFVSLANNHILDFNAAGLLDTLRHLDGAGIRHAGAGPDAAAAAAPAILNLPGVRVGVISATDTMPPFRSRSGASGTNFIDIDWRGAGLDAIARCALELRNAGASPIVLSLHWGPFMRLRPRASFRAFAYAAIDRGIDIVHGHSAHIFQAVKSYRGGVILFDTGGFIDDFWNFWNFGGFWNFPFRHDDWSFVFLVDIEFGRVRRLRLLPVRTRPWPLSLATGKTFDAIVDRMRALSAASPAPIQRTAEGLEMVLSA
jgi:poly-gamma-glutamate capsule biosynthesis protein CapA/YwtB (metallophosphatase superfamily)